MKSALLIVFVAVLCSSALAVMTQKGLRRCYETTNQRYVFTTASACPTGTTIDGSAGAAWLDNSGSCDTGYQLLYSHVSATSRKLSLSSSVSGFTSEGAIACVKKTATGGYVNLYELVYGNTFLYVDGTADRDLAITYGFTATGVTVGYVLEVVAGTPGRFVSG